VFQQFFYSGELPATCAADLRFTVAAGGRLNAVRMITKNLLAVTFHPLGSVDWTMNHLVVPLREPMTVMAGDEVQVIFAYRPGEEITALTDGLRAIVYRTATGTGGLRRPAAGSRPDTSRS
jgi:hypothetical protein